MPENSRIVLASASPRRLELLASAGIEFDVFASDIPEEPIPGEAPADFSVRLAKDKAVATAARSEGRWFIGADTIVVCDGEIMGKPADGADAVRMLKKLSGVPHEVITGYAIYDKARDGILCKAVVTKVFFKPLRDEEITAYVATGCPMDKAGAYAIQGGAACMVERIDGSYTNVVGLPLCEVVEDLRTMGAL
ncbi:maf protein [Geobacter metallireducens RCH3]|uniref:dTTP/UTP pyrophosphatase n=1 Tax=Geobacter metallireducens (strain ATCC 53774 / DSM 7210 / GS-15) TaxID=269799 RepID=NTPPA_GEOMG|nr:Maf family nucleotide pyrophosphatase [Geobacter metallireducens]Q39X87.1 RecName: Full=dTTP/UTP pyrophosphatase; Short=dTTPase/UTPase; AltName: Full=Nucleoside triphosphate pyrophosphatase; AltName: Full=Nucleotide pyrophosphatase; Short=Nucleotide PPase [Geobacter metallireducens GS-15]ABB31137.1 nucleotide/nucleic acid-binding septum formation-inhibiting protein [Geobacter metallireducens GS-15]EHP86919.1 maf protein [Geobacter metallireducens RCH3]